MSEVTLEQQIAAVQRSADRLESTLAVWGVIGDPEYVDHCHTSIAGLRAAAATLEMEKPTPFQQRVAPWMQACFGPEISADMLERCDRFFEESVEGMQALDYPAERAHSLVDYVYGRPKGDPPQEVGGIMVTLAALCLAAGMDMHQCGDVELARIWTVIEKIRAKQAAKPHRSPYPIPVEEARKICFGDAPAPLNCDVCNVEDHALTATPHGPFTVWLCVKCLPLHAARQAQRKSHG